MKKCNGVHHHSFKDEDQAWKLAPELRRRLLSEASLTNMVTETYQFSGAQRLMDTRGRKVKPGVLPDWWVILYHSRGL